MLAKNYVKIHYFFLFSNIHFKIPQIQSSLASIKDPKFGSHIPSLNRNYSYYIISYGNLYIILFINLKYMRFI